jgi:hypothetical protein
MVMAFVAGAGFAFWLRSGQPPAHVGVGEMRPHAEVAQASAVQLPAPSARPSPADGPALPQAEPPAPPALPADTLAALPPAAPAPPLPKALIDAEPPRGRIATGPPEPARAAPPRQDALALREPIPEAAPETIEEPSPPAEEEEDVVPRPPAGAPYIRVSFLVYSPAPERRTVSLAVDGGSLVTLHEGETTGEIEVERILPDRVHLRHAGRLFAVRARD